MTGISDLLSFEEFFVGVEEISCQPSKNKVPDEKKL
jgi:hypothetical protein